MARIFASLTLIVAVVFGCHCQVVADEPVDPLALLVRSLDQTENPEIRAALMQGMLTALDGRRNVSPPPQWKEVSAKLANSDSEKVRDLSHQLSQLFGDEEATLRALATLQDRSAKLDARRTALRSLLMQKNDQVSELLENLLNEPEMCLEAIRGYAAIENTNAAKILLQRYRELEPPFQRAIIETLASRKTYAESLLVAIDEKTVSRDDVPAHVARSLGNLLGDSFTKVYGDVRQLTEDRATLMAKYKKMLTPEAIERADAVRGRLVFEKTCASCHLLYGSGGKIGPDLTGSNRANLDYILLNSVDPSYDVPEGYKMVLIQTVDGRLLSGVIAEEDSQRLVLKTVEQPLVVIAKDDIEARKVSAKSMMPDGQLDQMKRQEVIDLIKYLQTTEQVEIAK